MSVVVTGDVVSMGLVISIMSPFSSVVVVCGTG